MLLFIPPIVQLVIAVVLIVAGVAMHSVIIDAIGCVALLVGGYRLLRGRGTKGISR